MAERGPQLTEATVSRHVARRRVELGRNRVKSERSTTLRSHHAFFCMTRKDETHEKGGVEGDNTCEPFAGVTHRGQLRYRLAVADAMKRACMFP